MTVNVHDLECKPNTGSRDNSGVGVRGSYMLSINIDEDIHPHTQDVPHSPVKSYYKGWGGIVGWGAVVASRRKEGVKIWRLSVALVTFC